MTICPFCGREMLKTGKPFQRHFPPFAVAQPHRLARLAAANAMQRQGQRFARLPHFFMQGRGRGKQQFVIIATGQHRLHRLRLRHAHLLQSRQRQRILPQLRAQSGSAQQMPQIGQQAVGNIQHRRRPHRQQPPQRQTRLRTAQGRQTLRPRIKGQFQRTLHALQTQRRAPRLAAHPQFIARACATATHSAFLRHVTNQRHRRRQRPARSIAAHQCHIIGIRAGIETFGKRRQPVVTHFRQGQRQRCPARARGHRRNV